LGHYLNPTIGPLFWLVLEQEEEGGRRKKTKRKENSKNKILLKKLIVSIDQPIWLNGLNLHNCKSVSN